MESFSNETQTLLGNTRGLDEKKDDDDDEDEDEEEREFFSIKDKTWSFSHSRRHVATTGTHEETYSKSPVVTKLRNSVDGGVIDKDTTSNKQQTIKKKGGQHYIFCLIYAIVNVVIAVPGLFGYAAVIFNHPIYSNHMNALSKCKFQLFILLT
jgi:hypothetical protein